MAFALQALTVLPCNAIVTVRLGAETSAPGRLLNAKCIAITLGHWSDNNMNEQEKRELDVWIANLMEPQPARVSLRYVRKPKDHLYNSAEHTTPNGWWMCKTGSDAEDENGEDTYCIWQPSFNICEYPNYLQNNGAAMDVLKKCVDRLCEEDNEETVSIGFEVPNIWVVEKTNNVKNLRVEAATLEISICLFAKKLFTK